MIKIGNCYFNESQIAAIQPSKNGQHADVYLVNEAVISVEVWEDELPALLERAGLLSFGPAVEVLTFSPEEHKELRLAYEDGYLFAAKDNTGQTFVYKSRPEKYSACWGGTEAGQLSRRLHGEFECLSFEDDKPLDLAALFDRDDEDGV